MKINLQEEKKIFNPYTCGSPMGHEKSRSPWPPGAPWLEVKGHDVHAPYQHQVRRARSGVQRTARSSKEKALSLSKTLPFNPLNNLCSHSGIIKA